MTIKVNLNGLSLDCIRKWEEEKPEAEGYPGQYNAILQALIVKALESVKPEVEKLEWFTTDKSLDNGFYFCRKKGAGCKFVSEVYNGQFEIRCVGVFLSKSWSVYEFSGPIQEPEDE